MAWLEIGKYNEDIAKYEALDKVVAETKPKLTVVKEDVKNAQSNNIESSETPPRTFTYLDENRKQVSIYFNEWQNVSIGGKEYVWYNEETVLWEKINSDIPVVVLTNSSIQISPLSEWRAKDFWKVIWKNWDTYTWNFVGGKFEWDWTYTSLKNEYTYTWEFQENNFHWEGKKVRKDWKYYEWDFLEDRFDWDWKLVFPDLSEYNWSFVWGYKEDWYWRNMNDGKDRKYTWMYINDKKSGRWKLIYNSDNADSYVYEGNFLDNNMHWYGEKTYQNWKIEKWLFLEDRYLDLKDLFNKTTIDYINQRLHHEYLNEFVDVTISSMNIDESGNIDLVIKAWNSWVNYAFQISSEQTTYDKLMKNYHHKVPRYTISNEKVSNIFVDALFDSGWDFENILQLKANNDNKD